MIFLFFFFNVADLLSFYLGIFKIRASYGFNLLFFPLMLSFGYTITKKFLWGFFIFSTLSIVSALNSSLFWRSFSYYLQEIYILAGCFFVAAWIIRSFSAKKVLSIYLATYLLIAAYGLFQFIAPYIGFSDPMILQQVDTFFNRPNSVCLEPAFYSFYLSIVLCGYGVYLALNQAGSRSQRALLFFLSVASLFSITTTALIQFLWIFAFCFALFIILKKKNLWSFCLPLLSAGSIYVLMMVSSPTLAWPVFGKFIQEDGSLTTGPDTARVEYATSAWEYFKKSPLFGYSYGGLGPLVFAQSINQESENLALLEGSDFWEKDPQPIPFQLLASYGLVGVIGFAIAVFLFVKRGFLAYKLAVNPDQKYLIFASLSSLLAVAIGGVWMVGPLIPAVWVHLGLCFGLWCKTCQEAKRVATAS